MSLRRSLLAFLALVLGTIALASPVPKDAQAAAQAMLDRFVDSWNRADGAAYAENYWPEAELVDPTGAIVSGRDAIAQEHVNLWAGPFKGSRIRGSIRRVTMLGLDHMIVDLDLEVTGVHDIPPGAVQNTGGVLRNHLKHILEKRKGVWKVLSAQNTFIAR